MIQRVKAYEVTAAFDASKEDTQFYLLDTCFFNITYQQLLASIDRMLYDYIEQTGGNLKYVEVRNFYTRENIELPDKYPKPVTGGVLHGNKI